MSSIHSMTRRAATLKGDDPVSPEESLFRSELGRVILEALNIGVGVAGPVRANRQWLI